MEEVTAMQKAGVTRRDLMKMGLTAGVGGIVSIGGGRSFLPNLADAATFGFPGAMISPVQQLPWTDPLPIPQSPKAVTCDPLYQGQPGYMKGPDADEGQCLASVDLPHPGLADPVTGEIPTCTFTEARNEGHQRWQEILKLNGVVAPYYLPPGDVKNTHYELCCKEVEWNFYSDFDNGRLSPGKSTVWTYFDLHSNAGPLLRIQAHYGQPVLMRMYNMMPHDNKGVCGISQMSCHLHNAHNPPESDGGPLRFYDTGQFFDYWYPNIREGFASTHKAGTTFVGPDGVSRKCPGDYKETQGSLWFHDHRMDFTSQNVYRGMASFYSLYSDDINLDTGVESADPAKKGLGLPAGEYDIPMVFTCKSFLPNGEMFFDLNDTRGMIGDMQTVNFKIQPYLDVKKRKYRFRLLNAGPSRYGQYCITDNTGKKISFLRISNDGNLLPKALQVTDVRIGPAERADIIVDFGALPPGTTLWLHNVLEQTTPHDISGKTMLPDMSVSLANLTKVLKFNVTSAAFTDYTKTMAQLLAQSQLPLPDMPGQTAKVTRASAITAMLKDKTIKNRSFNFGKNPLNQWVVNDKIFDPSVITAYPIEGQGEIWQFAGGIGWSHPVHHHHAESQILTINGKTTLPAEEVSRKDVIRIGDGSDGTNNRSAVQIYIRFRDWYGDYPVHCHNVVHEDHAMMFRVKVVPPTDPNAGK